jgi:hypothetical protein
MNNQQAIDIARVMLTEVRNNLDTQQRQLGDQADNAYFEKQFTELFLLQLKLTELENN